MPNSGGLSATDRTAWNSEVVKRLEVTTDDIVRNDDITIPYDPFIGTISTSPKIGSVNALTPFKHGGNGPPERAPG